MVPKGTARDAAEKIAMQIAEFPQTCMRNDRTSAYPSILLFFSIIIALIVSSYEQHDLQFSEALKNEFAHGMKSLYSEDTKQGIQKFIGGAGRHGSFSKL